jgi:hypothetical protein
VLVGPAAVRAHETGRVRVVDHDERAMALGRRRSCQRRQRLPWRTPRPGGDDAEARESVPPQARLQIGEAAVL